MVEKVQKYKTKLVYWWDMKNNTGWTLNVIEADEDYSSKYYCNDCNKFTKIKMVTQKIAW